MTPLLTPAPNGTFGHTNAEPVHGEFVGHRDPALMVFTNILSISRYAMGRNTVQHLPLFHGLRLIDGGWIIFDDSNEMKNKYLQKCQQVNESAWHGVICKMYRQVSNIRRTKFQQLKNYRTVLRLSLPNPLKPDVKSIMKM